MREVQSKHVNGGARQNEEKERREMREMREMRIHYLPLTKVAKERHIDAPSSAGWREKRNKW